MHSIAARMILSRCAPICAASRFGMPSPPVACFNKFTARCRPLDNSFKKNECIFSYYSTWGGAMTTTTGLLTTVLAMTGAAAVGAPAQAAPQNAGPESLVLEEILVTAQKRE